VWGGALRRRQIRMRTVCGRLVIMLLFVGQAAFAQVPAVFGPTPTALVIPESYEGNEIQLKTWLQTPGGSGPYNTVMLIPGCDGLDQNGWAQMRTWATWLMQLNYAVLTIDSFTPRHVTNTCTNGEVVPGELHAADFYTAAAYISHLSQLQGGKIGGMGFSHGGWGVLEAASSRTPGIVALRSRLETEHFGIAALVAVYPACFRHIEANFQVPLLILIGEDDDWTPARACRRLAAYPRQNGSQVQLKVYPNAYHVFDVDKPPRQYVGHQLAYDAEATANARHDIQEFFAHWLR
jgi:dienelactone hydrolase